MKTAYLVLIGLTVAVCMGVHQLHCPRPRKMSGLSPPTRAAPIMILCQSVSARSTSSSAHRGVPKDFATIFEGEGDKWKQTAHLTGDGGAFGQAVAITDIRGRSNTAFAIVGAPTHDGAGEARVFALSGRDWNAAGETPRQ